ncbi:MAG: glycosyltransferase family 2 protein [Lachnospiraceae bacterium]|nr:glycosyltransferase family 2 protein [Lachnospiraceae bacterium]
MISIVVPVYNAAPYIENTVQMVLQQTYQDFELILVDDCSTDNSVALLEELLEQRKDVRLRLVKKERNQGAAAARNTGLDMASGRYIAFLDADDVWLPHRLEAGLRFMEEKKAGFVFSAYEFGDEQARGTGKIVHVPEKLTYRKALSRTVVFTTTTLFDTTLVPKELLRMPTVPSEDTATWWQILRNGHVAYGLDQVLAIYRRPAKSLSSNKLVALQRIWNLYRKQEKLGLFSSAFYFCFWALRATLRRI